MILYHGEPNGPSLAVLAALGESGLAAECHPIDLLGGERHRLPGLSEPLARDMAVEGEGPVLVIDGEAMTESVFLAQYLDEAGAAAGTGTRLQPTDAYARWQVEMWCRRITERCAPAAACLANRAWSAARLADVGDFEAMVAPIASADLAQRWRNTRAGGEPEEVLADSRAKVAQAVKMVEDALADGREWLMGPVSIADFETYGWLAGLVDLEPGAFADKPLTAAWLARVQARPSVQAALARATAPQPEHSWAPGPEINRWG